MINSIINWILGQPKGANVEDIVTEQQGLRPGLDPEKNEDHRFAVEDLLDLRFLADSSSRVEVRGMVIAEQFEVPGRGVVRGMCVSTEDAVFGGGMRRPGYGRGLQSWNENVECGAEVVRALAFPFEDVSEDDYDSMDAFDTNEGEE